LSQINAVRRICAQIFHMESDMVPARLELGHKLVSRRLVRRSHISIIGQDGILHPFGVVTTEPLVADEPV
jgi:hypothetical protein